MRVGRPHREFEIHPAVDGILREYLDNWVDRSALGNGEVGMKELGFHRADFDGSQAVPALEIQGLHQPKGGGGGVDPVDPASRSERERLKGEHIEWRCHQGSLIRIDPVRPREEKRAETASHSRDHLGGGPEHHGGGPCLDLDVVEDDGGKWERVAVIEENDRGNDRYESELLLRIPEGFKGIAVPAVFGQPVVPSLHHGIIGRGRWDRLVARDGVQYGTGWIRGPP